MIPQLRKLDEKEIKMLVDAPVLITILIAGADGKIDQKEIDWGTKLAHLRAVKEESMLNYYYKDVDRNFNYILKDYIESLPKDVEERGRKISEMLSQLNYILPKLNKHYASELYKSFLSYATQVAKSSGGILGYAAISPEEEKWIGLHMIDPVVIIEEEVEDAEESEGQEDEEE